ncbi:MAG: DUF6429 family protein [Gammaproteobacteria bacterium]|nr:DUF6429 family protein [Gammaproteobacteria bacterium]MDH3469403.1 DUF6429 family protein [Gammaproteobacteria bacterium]
MPIPEEFDSERLAEIGLAILCLTASTDKVGTRAWKGMDWDVMGLLYERGWIGNPVGKAKSVIVTEEGLEKGESISGEVFWGRVIDWAPGHITMRRTGPLTSVMLLAVARSPPYAQLPVSFNVMQYKMKIKSLLEKYFYHDGRGPELQSVVWNSDGVIPKGFEYYNPDDGYEENNLKHIKLIGVQAYSMAGEEVHGNIKTLSNSHAAILEIVNSDWLASFLPAHINKCKHYQIMFYDEIYDMMCENIIAGKGKINA